MTSITHDWQFRRQLMRSVLGALLFVASHTSAAAQPTTPPPIHIEAEQMEVQQKTRTVRFIGNVRIQRGGLHLHCKELTGTYSEKGQIVRLNAEGPVTVKGPDFEASADQATYTQDPTRLMLQGNPSLRRGASVLKGRTITVWLDEERVVIDGARGTLEPSLLSSPGRPR